MTHQEPENGEQQDVVPLLRDEVLPVHWAWLGLEEQREKGVGERAGGGRL